MITVIYSKKGKPINDFKAEEFVQKALKTNKDATFHISSEIALNYFCCYVNEGKLDHNNIKFVIDGKDTKVNEKGVLERYASFSALDDSLTRLIS